MDGNLGYVVAQTLQQYWIDTILRYYTTSTTARTPIINTHIYLCMCVCVCVGLVRPTSRRVIGYLCAGREAICFDRGARRARPEVGRNLI